MSNVLISIIVPSCNVEQFVARCLGSMVFDSCQASVEIIVVDDASTDGSLQVVESLADSIGIRIVQHQINHGLGASRNSGLEAATGEYVWFVDGDDFLHVGAIDRVVNALDEHSPDVLVVDFTCADEAGQPIDWIRCPFGPDHGNVLSGAEFFCRHFATTYAWIYLVKRYLLVRNGLRFQPRINMQDAELLPRVLALASSVFVSGIPAYVYVKRETSFINSADSHVRERYFASALEVHFRLRKFREQVHELAMLAGMNAKLRAIEKIALLAFAYDPLDRTGRSRRLVQLRAQGLFPFPPLTQATAMQALVRHGVNAFPLSFPVMFAWGRRQFRRTMGVRP